MTEHPIDQPITHIDVYIHDGESAGFVVGADGVTRLEATTKSGLHADIPYVRVWRGDECAAEFCQHNIVGVFFGKPEADQ